MRAQLDSKIDAATQSRSQLNDFTEKLQNKLVLKLYFHIDDIQGQWKLLV